VSDHPLVTVIIPHFNQPEFLAKCLASLPDPNAPGVPSYEVLVVDNGSRELPSDVIAAVPQARLLQEAEPGPGPARNKDASEAKVLTCP